MMDNKHKQKYNYYLCAYGTNFRISCKSLTPEGAAKYCYGVTNRVTSVNINGRKWHTLPEYIKNKYLQILKELHMKETGNKLDGI